MSARRPLTHAGHDVAPIARRADGRVVVVYLDRFGGPTTHTAEAFPHELRGLGWALGDIKRLVELLPLCPLPATDTDSRSAAPPPAVDTPRDGRRPVRGLFAHHSLPPGDR